MLSSAFVRGLPFCDPRGYFNDRKLTEGQDKTVGQKKGDGHVLRQGKP